MTLKERKAQAERTFIEKFKQKHGDKYDLSAVDYVNSKTKVDIICPIHGVWRTTPENAIRFQCAKCRQEKVFNDNGYGQKLGYLYYLEIKLDNGQTVWKIGISTENPSTRYQSQKYQNFKLLSVFTKDTLVDAYRVEQRILEAFADKRAINVTKQMFGAGYTELLSEDVFRGNHKAIENFGDTHVV